MNLPALAIQAEAFRGELDPSILTILAAIVLLAGLAAMRRAVMPFREILTAVAAAGLGLLLVILALLLLIGSLIINSR
ncbi:hypothetical protein ACFQS1_03365 [Paractinoplanes rhizophilus]|uniref:Uncharacterized protein n=1 Tax=Paractinoplanes rhizophilus TaxID=1416877 RepID=A0ABW2HMR1_9ACTN